MVDQKWKDALSLLAQPPIRLLAVWYRLTWRSRSTPGPVRLHLGCGSKYLPGFLNADFNPFQKLDLWVDLRRRFPLPDQVAEGIYNSDFVEHFYPADLQSLLRDCLRVLKPGGQIRIGVPHLGHAIDAFVRGDAAWFPDWPRSYKSLGGRLSNLLFCNGQHRNAFDFQMMREVLEEAGFRDIEECSARQSRWVKPEALSFEQLSEKGKPGLTMYVEARRPS